MKSAWKLCAIMFLATSLVAQTSTPPKPKKAKASAATITAADVQALKDAIASQQAAIAHQEHQIQELRDALQHRDQAVQQAQSAAADAAGKADAAQAQAVQQQQTVSELKTRCSRPQDECDQYGVNPAGDAKERHRSNGKPGSPALQGNHHYAGRIPRG